MIEAVTSVARADAVAVATVASASARSTLEGRQKRLRWLGALHAANGEPLPIDDEARDEKILAEGRARIRAALDTIEELHAFESEEAEDAEAPDAEVSASRVAALITASREASLASQAHLGAASIRQILG